MNVAVIESTNPRTSRIRQAVIVAAAAAVLSTGFVSTAQAAPSASQGYTTCAVGAVRSQATAYGTKKHTLDEYGTRYETSFPYSGGYVTNTFYSGANPMTAGLISTSGNISTYSFRCSD